MDQHAMTPHGRPRRANAKDTAMQPGRDELRQWERDWRTTIQGQVDTTAKSLTEVAAIVREMQTDVRELKAWKEDVEERKTKKIDSAPDNRRADISLYISIGVFMFYVLSYFAQHYKP